MEFSFKEETEKLMLASENINEIIDRYNEILTGLSDNEKNIMLLHYGFRKLDTFRKMTPKGNYWDEKREAKINDGLKKLQIIGNKTFPGVSDLDEIRYNVDSYMNNSNLLKVIRNFSSDIKNTYKKYSHYVYTILPINDLKELEASKHRENQYLNSINNGVFATATMESIEKYIARANVGSMIADGSVVKYPSNPFLNISEEGLTLIKPVSIYLSNVDLFEPQFDYDLDENGNARFIFGGEWIAPYEKVECIEKQTTYLPASFLEHNEVYYQENGEDKQINIPLNNQNHYNKKEVKIMNLNLQFKEIMQNKDLVAESTYDCIKNLYTEDEQKQFLVSEINPEYMDGVKLFEHYDINNKIGVNCLICECKRGDTIKYAALLVPTGYKYNMSSTVRKHTNSRMVSVAPLDYVLEKTKMEYGSINPIGLPEDWKIYIDPKILESETIICGSGLQKSKISFPSKLLLKLKNIEILEDLAKE